MVVGGHPVSAAELKGAVDHLPPPQQAGYRVQPLLAARWWGRQVALATEAERRGLGSEELRHDEDAVQRSSGLTSLLIAQIAGSIRLSPREVEAYYKSHSEEFARARAHHILVADTESLGFRSERSPQEAQEKATNLRARLAHGADFSQLARDNSDDSRTKGDGGNLGILTPHQMGADFDSVLWKLTPNEVSAPFSTPLGYELVRVDEVFKAPLAEVRGQIEGRLKSEAIEKALSRIVTDSHIRYDHKALARMAAESPDAP
jgi:hypothetical protein